MQQQERSNAFLIRLMAGLAKRLPRSIVRLILPFITIYFYVTSPQSLRSSKSFLQRIHRRRVGPFAVLKHMHRFSSIVLDRVYFVTDQFGYFNIRTHNKEQIDAVLQAHGSCILLGSHLGSFEVLRSIAVSENKFPLKILMHRPHNEMITEVLEELNPTIAETVIDLSMPDAILSVQGAIDEGYSIGLLGDRHTGSDRLVDAQLLGDPIKISAGPFLLASIFKRPIILFYGLYRGGNTYDLYFELLSDKIHIDRNNRQQDLENICQRYCLSLEQHIQKDPLNWFNFYDFWEQNGH